MITSRYIFTAGAVLLSTALAVTLLNSKSEKTLIAIEADSWKVPINLKSEKIGTWNCEIPEFQPESITLTCADGGWIIESIVWNSWLVGGAHGSAIFRKNTCEPSCAEGEILREPVQISLSNVVQRGGEYYFRTLDIFTTSDQDSRERETERLEWDVMEFVEIMRWGD
jgi:hypothetical protein